jgi:hypothetical protein
MEWVRLINQYLERAIEAEAKAAMHIDDEYLRKHWLDIACGYRNLAQARQTALASEEASDPPLSSPESQASPGRTPPS